MVIGIRSFADGFSYVILSGTQDAPVVVAKDRFKYPKNCPFVQALTWLRKQMGEILQAHPGIRHACLKTIERMAMKKSPERLRAEGVVLELLNSCGVSCCTRIKSQIKRDIRHFAEPARYLERVLKDSTSLADLNKPAFQEAALAAIAELHSE